jgi:hypothetical protein
MYFATDRTRCWRTAPAKAISRNFSPPSCFRRNLVSLPFFVSFFVECRQAIAGSTIIAMPSLSRHGLSIGPQSGECKANSLRIIALPVSESKGPNWRKWRIFLCVILDSSTGASWDRCGYLQTWWERRRWGGVQVWSYEMASRY